MKESRPSASSLLERLGLHRPELRAWALYDWANSAFVTTVIAAVFPIYYQKVAAGGLPAAEATYRYSLATSVALITTALLAPFLGALSDIWGHKKALLLVSQSLSVVATALMWFIGPGDWALALALFVIANIGITAAFVFYDSLLPHIARDDELDRVSTAGYALGYLGGGLLLVINMLWIAKPHWFGLADAGVASRASLVSVAIWWTVFSIPLYRGVREPARRADAAESRDSGALRAAFRRLVGTFHELRRFRPAFLLMLAFFLYSDGINTIIRMASLYGAQIGIEPLHLLGALVLVQFVGIPCSFAFGQLAAKIGTQRAIFASLAVYVVVALLGHRMTTARDFYVLAGLVALVQGGSQALSRSLFASMIPRHSSAEFFGFFAVFEKFAGILGPLVFAEAIHLSGSTRTAILSICGFFVLGGALLARVDVEAGRRAAREANEQASAL
jgi:UMF1 family MFS transporter